MNCTDSDVNQQRADQFARRVTAHLTQGNQELPHDISERLRAARVQAVEKRKWVLSQSAVDVYAQGESGTLTAGHGAHHSNWWNRLGVAGLVLTLVLGLMTISIIQDESGASRLR